MYDYWLWDNALPKWFCKAQIKNMKWDKTNIAQVQRNNEGVVDKNSRVTDILWEEQNSPIGCIAKEYITMANQKAGWNFDLTNGEKIQIGKYDSKDKGFYDWHQDNGFNVNKNGLLRKLSISILLNDPKDFEGGMFEFKDFEKQPVLKQGSILVFKSILNHRVTPVTSGTRYSAVTWVSGPAYR